MAEMNIINVDVSVIRPYDNNPRRNEKAVDAVANSIREFGFKNPIILDPDYVIISGHTRRLAAIKLGMQKVPCYIVDDLTEEQIRAFRLADNRVASFATWDEKKLNEEIAKIMDVDLSEFGFKKETIAAVMRESLGEDVHVCPRCGHEWEG